MTEEKITISEINVSGNKYNVPAKQWNKWDITARTLFNYLYHQGTVNRDYLFHIHNPPKDAIKITETGAWNMAWLAADFISKKNHDNINPDSKTRRSYANT